MKSSLEIAQDAILQPIGDVADAAGLHADEVEPYGRYKAKISLSVLERLADRPDGKLVCVTAMTPTPPGEGKTTTLVGLTQGLGHIGRNPVACLREPLPATCGPPLRRCRWRAGDRRHPLGSLWRHPGESGETPKTSSARPRGPRTPASRPPERATTLRSDSSWFSDSGRGP